jgi:hypothetical protein
MEREATACCARGVSRREQRHERALAMRYRGQSFELESRKTTGDLARSFIVRIASVTVTRRSKRDRDRERAVAIVGRVEKLPLTKDSRQPRGDSAMYLDGERQRLRFTRETTRGGVKLRTPCIVTEYSATTLMPRSKAPVDQFGNS